MSSKPPTGSQIPVKFSGHKSFEKRNVVLLIFTWWTWDHVTLMVGVCHGNSVILPDSVLICFLQIKIWRTESVTWLHKTRHWRLRWLYRWELLAVCHHPEKVDGHSHCDSRDLITLICHVTSSYHVFKRSCNFMGEIPL